MKPKVSILLRSLLFIVVVLLLLYCVNIFFQPVWPEWNGYNATHGIYAEPKNTIEVVAFGASVTANGIDTPDMYNEYGICAYNMGTQRQPVAASYYWLQELLRLHGDSLKTVIMDASTLRHIPEESFFHTCVDPMRNPVLKYKVYREHFGYSVNESLTALMPLYFYHTRWAGELENQDIFKFDYSHAVGSRGYHFEPLTYADVSVVRDRYIPLTEEGYAGIGSLNETSISYFDRIYQLCQENDLKLILIKTPAWNWGRSFSEETKVLADQYQIDYFDFQFPPLFDEIGYNHDLDSYDGKHLNYYGAQKVSRWLAEYLLENGYATDVRQDPKYSFMEEQYQAFTETSGLKLELTAIDDVATYLSTAVNDDTTVFISVMDEGAAALTDEQRSVFAELGLSELSQLVYRNSYIGVIEEGAVSYEMRKPAADDGKALMHRGKLPKGKSFVVQSGSYTDGNIASCKIAGKEEAIKRCGLNIVVYSNKYNCVIDSACFNTNMNAIGQETILSK